jgi:hypothetical protein
MVQKNETTKLSLTLGALRLDYEGRDDFLKAEVPKLVQSMDKLQVSRLMIPLNVLQMAIEDAFATQKDVDGAIVSTKNDIDAMSELGETESLRLQMAMDRMSKMMSTLSNLLKKASETASGITQNLK